MAANKTLFAFALMLLAYPAPHTAFAWGEKQPTAVIVDNETGKPVEGAVAIAQWNTIDKARPWWEGGGDKLEKAVEVFSDAEGKIYIDGFWGLYIFSQKPRLTVYKGGYVVWDSWEKCPDYEKRTDFDRKKRTIRLQKFDKYYPLWMKKYSYIIYPHNDHASFFSHCLHIFMVSEIYPSKDFSIFDIFKKHDGYLASKETRERDRRRYLEWQKEIEETNRRRKGGNKQR